VTQDIVLKLEGLNPASRSKIGNCGEAMIYGGGKCWVDPTSGSSPLLKQTSGNTGIGSCHGLCGRGYRLHSMTMPGTY